MLVVVALHGAVGGFVLILAVGAYQYGGHHGQRAEAGRHHITHDVAVIVLESPEHSALRADDTGDGVVDQSVEILDAGLLESFFVLCVIELLEDSLKVSVVSLGDRILG